jgi:hypothetical protein
MAFDAGYRFNGDFLCHDLNLPLVPVELLVL